MDAEHLIAQGEMRATVKALSADVADIKADQKAQNGKLDQLLAYHHQRKGARAVTKATVAVITSGGFVGWLFEHFSK
jgi:hypothetical protein